MDEDEFEWVLERDGSGDRPDYLTRHGSWHHLCGATKWFRDADHARSAACPEHTTGTPKVLYAAPR